MNKFDPTPNRDDITRGPDAYKRETVKVTPARIGLIVLAVITVLFIVQNNGPVTFKILLWTFEDVALWLLLVISLALGFGLGYLTNVMRGRRKTAAK
ncbi:MAG: LapA family protein [Actinobacteria bacterium]|nr:LapA family protein [Actinomycetota bacterium]